ncbi:M23 family metallopeptidase [Trichloromonas sp.]|uniref:M23 family metallopeptidase n=1 Tax=Trichloromonas sp. TaxID=3069249 RepID=UPI002A48AE68|nr:M23 family metallopeptidase [Trichloromonas sp.]
MSAKKYTVLMIPEGSHQVRRFAVRRWWLGVASVLGMALLFGAALLVYDYARIRIDHSELKRLRTENHLRLAELRQLTERLEGLRQELIVLAQNDAKVRVMAKLTRPKADALTGLGGPLEEDPAEEFSEVQRRIDEIMRAIDLHRASQEEVHGLLSDERSLLGSKPRGWPTRGLVTSGFGMRRSPFSGRPVMHEGIDIAARTGTPIYATAGGIVSRAETVAGYGKIVIIDHGYGFQTYYAHNSKIHVKVGQRVKRGEKIAAVGNTGRSTGPHVHYEVRRNKVPLNPKKYI